MPADADSSAALCGTQTPLLNQSQVVAITKPRPRIYTVGYRQKFAQAWRRRIVILAYRQAVHSSSVIVLHRPTTTSASPQFFVKHYFIRKS